MESKSIDIEKCPNINLKLKKIASELNKFIISNGRFCLEDENDQLDILHDIYNNDLFSMNDSIVIPKTLTGLFVHVDNIRYIYKGRNIPKWFVKKYGNLFEHPLETD